MATTKNAPCVPRYAADTTEEQWRVVGWAYSHLDKPDDHAVIRQAADSLSPQMFTDYQARWAFCGLVDALRMDDPQPFYMLVGAKDWAAEGGFDVARLEAEARPVARTGHSVPIDAAAAVANGYVRESTGLAVDDLSRAVANGATAEVIADMAEAVKAAAAGYRAKRSPSRLLSMSAVLREWRTRERAPVIETGFYPLDRLGGGGLPAGGLTVLAGAPSAGKSALAMQATLGALYADRGLRAVWAAGEMTVEKIAQRAVVAWAAGPASRMVSMGGAESRSRGALEVADALEEALGDRLAILPAPIPIGDIEAAVVATDAKLLVVDYVQLVTVLNATDRRAEVDAVVRSLRTLATQRGVAVVVLSNIAASVAKAGDKEARAGAVGKESNEIDFAADILLLGVAADEEENGRRSVLWRCLKNRHGDRQNIDTLFQGARQRFTAVVNEVEDFADFGPHGGR